MTTWPPRMACTATPSTAINPSQRSHGRFSFTQSNTASTRVRTPKPPAKTRCENSNKSPPCSIDSDGVPHEILQRGDEQRRVPQRRHHAECLDAKLLRFLASLGLDLVGRHA